MAENIFEKVLENVDIVDVVKSYVNLEPKGKNLFGLCPFHDDNNPSMSVSREKQIFYCFVCKKGGNAIKFIEEYKHMPYIDAARFLAKEYHIDVSEFDNPKTSSTSRYYNCTGTAQKFFSFLMNDENYSKTAREYLKRRGIDDNTIKEFSIGLSPSDGKSLTKTLKDKGFIISDLIETGLANEENDIFIDRVMIPIKDEQGRCVAFGGRIYKDSDQSKYVNSKETPIFKKGEILFNLDKAVKEIKKSGKLIINEGYMDVITSYSRGVKNVIALMGTAMTINQAALIKKYTDNVVICLDGDRPGINAVSSIIKPLEEKNINYSIVILKDGMDPDEYIRKYGKDAYIDEIENKKIDKIGYFYQLTKLDFGDINVYNMESFKNQIFIHLKDEKSRSTLEVYLKKLSQDLGVSYNSLDEDFTLFMGKYDPSYRKKTLPISSKFEVKGIREAAEKMIVDYALKDKTYFDDIVIKMGTRIFMKSKKLRKMFVEIGDIYDIDSYIKTDDLINMLKERGVYQDYFYDDKTIFSESDLVNNIIGTIKKENLREEIMALKKHLGDPSTNADEQKALQKEIQEKILELKK